MLRRVRQRLARLLQRRQLPPSEHDQHVLAQLHDLWPRLQHVVLFVRFGAGDSLPPWQCLFLAELAELGWQVWVVDHSTQPLSPSAQVACCCSLYLRRPNRGMCLGGFAHAIALLHHVRAQDAQTSSSPERHPGPISLALINDSFLPLLPLAGNEVLSTLLQPGVNDDQVRGLTESCEQGYHLQSYLLVLGQQAWLSDASRQHWERCLRLAGRHQVIAAGEVGLSQCWRQQGLRLQPALPLSALAAAGRTRIPVERNDSLSALQQNAYLVYWRELLLLCGIFKKSALTDLHQSRVSQATLQEFLEVAAAAGVHEPSTVIDHLVRPTDAS